MEPFMQSQIDIKVPIATELIPLARLTRIRTAHVGTSGNRIVERLWTAVRILMLPHLDRPCLHHIALPFPVCRPSKAIGDTERQPAGYAPNSREVPVADQRIHKMAHIAAIMLSM